MSIIGTIQSFSNSDIVKRVVKTVVEVVAAQTALYTTVIPNAPKPATSAAVAGGAGLLSLVWNGLVAWYNKHQTTKLVKLQGAIEAAVAKIEAAKAEAVVPPKV